MKFSHFGDIGSRNKAVLNLMKLNVYRIHEKYFEFERLPQHTFNLAIFCHFDKQIDKLLSGLLAFICLPDDYLKKRSCQ